jgi:hypothetical protein
MDKEKNEKKGLKNDTNDSRTGLKEMRTKRLKNNKTEELKNMTY